MLKSSKVLELKEFHLWDWRQIDNILDIIDTKKELILELNKQKFFKKLLFSYSPSKNLIVKQQWIVNNFFYGAIGKKLFKLLVNSHDGISVLDSPNEDYIFHVYSTSGVIYYQNPLKMSDKLTAYCDKPGCAHEDETCPAYIGEWTFIAFIIIFKA